MLLKLSQHIVSKYCFESSVVLDPQPTTTFWVSCLNWRPSSEARFLSLLICIIIPKSRSFSSSEVYSSYSWDRIVRLCFPQLHQWYSLALGKSLLLVTGWFGVQIQRARRSTTNCPFLSLGISHDVSFWEFPDARAVKQATVLLINNCILSSHQC